MVGAVAGMMVAPIVYLDPNMMGGILLYVTCGRAPRRHRQPDGRGDRWIHRRRARELLGAFVIGNELKLTVALVLIVGVLLVRPSGFFGSVHVSRV